ncbi:MULTISPECIES: mercury transport protein [Hyphomicrobiales]|jgi:mercuric ion transport protein|uniref:Mercury transport protein n=2 Tax=Bradyrhizobium TaxID=374 RepID=A0A5P6P797_9BRAD|nr:MULTISPECIES: mercury transport protein [Bradyrhizobium]MCP4735272.1 mercury transport protein [Bosea sp. (in: a-proteobacteria)]MBR1037042.1 mercury transport protein [Bradyrhizobium viridifuturi]MBR1074683.1 mercury transport protein [Bradyrhizobium viridifuturi]MBR1134493.1 mercury transport protein [Bradyrhizobium denitrificans]MBR1205139.1 mercury transport protein [Bradyrhizobium sp. AUGA SZCCT0124]
MSDRTAIRVGMAGAVLVAICCAAPLIAVGLSFAGLGAWLAGKGLVVLPLMAASFGLIAWIFHRRHAKAARCETTIHKEGVKP